MINSKEKLEKLAVLQEKLTLKEGLPHLYGFPHYKWSRKFFESRNRFNFLCAANQIGKSSAAIRKAIEWATNTDLWPELWKTKPLQFWYLYPTKEVSTIEVKKKWAMEFLPQGEFKDHPKYGWSIEMDKKYVWAIHFNTGVSIYFKTYAQEVTHLQSGTVSAIFCDEELPEELFSELKFRLASTSGYFHMVFTATLGQEFWRETIEERGDTSRFKNALKQQISMYDCLEYEDGSTTPWSVAKIEEEKETCPTDAEIKRRIYGKFVKAEGLKYPSFVRDLNVQTNIQKVPADWNIYSGVDYGSGGNSGHPSAIVFIALSADGRKGRLVHGWRGDKISTTAGDLYNTYMKLKDDKRVVAQFYDSSAKDFYTIAARNGETFIPADKTREAGEAALNTLFKHRMLDIDDRDEHWGLVKELETLLHTTPKTKAKDDFIDALRYCIMGMPWDWSAVTGLKPGVVKKKVKTHAERRRDWVLGTDLNDFQTLFDDEIAFWNDTYQV